MLLHNMLGMYNPREEWEFQLKNSVGINGELTWVKEFRVDLDKDFQTIARARAGFFFNNIELGGVFRWGRFNDNTKTSFWNTRLNTKHKKNRRELFFYFWPSISIYAYNATIQRGLFRRDKGPVTGTLNTFLYQQKIGLMGSWNRFSLNLSVNYQMKETASQEKTQFYGTVELKYLLK